MEVNSEDYRRGVRSLTRGLSHQQAAVGEAKIFRTAAVQGWSDAEFKGNFRVSRPTFAYLVSELKPTLERQDFLRSSIPVSLQCCPLFAPIVPTLVENEEKRDQLQIHR